MTWSTLAKAFSKIFGDWEISYATLVQYLQSVKDSNLGSVYKIIVDNPQSDGIALFKCIFSTFGPSIEDFEHCCHVLNIYRMHLYGKRRLGLKWLVQVLLAMTFLLVLWDSWWGSSIIIPSSSKPDSWKKAKDQEFADCGSFRACLRICRTWPRSWWSVISSY